MNKPNMRLINVHPELQQMYNIGSQVDVCADSSVNGGHFTFMNKAGKEISADAVEFCGYDQKYIDL